MLLKATILQMTINVSESGNAKIPTNFDIYNFLRFCLFAFTQMKDKIGCRT